MALVTWSYDEAYQLTREQRSGASGGKRGQVTYFPVRAGLVTQAHEYAWSSAREHALGDDDPLLSPGHPFPDAAGVGDWKTWLASAADDEAVRAIRRNTATGRPTGSPTFVGRLEALLGRSLTAGKRGRKPKGRGNGGNE